MRQFIFPLLLSTVLMGCDVATSPDSTNLSSAQNPVQTGWGVPDEHRNLDNQNASTLFQKNILLILDMSGSMQEAACNSPRQSKADVIHQVLPEFIRSIPNNVAVGLVVFDRRGIRVVAPLGTNEEGRSQIISFASSAQPSGGTPLTEAFALARKQLEDQSKAQLGYGSYQILTITDGAADSITTLNKQVDEILTTTPIQINTAGFCIAAHHSLNEPGVTVYHDVGDANTLTATLRDAVAENETYSDADKY